MRYITLIITILLAVSGIHAQIQKGYIKTQGRPNRPGKPLAGVTIRWKGAMNAVISDADGKITTVFPGKKQGDAISLLTVRKNGYELIDPDLIGRQLVFSPIVPIEIVMASSTELEANRKRISDNAYKRAEAQYQAREKQLKQQLHEEDITISQYQKKLQTLQDNYERYISLIDEMADRYARTDYDHLDSIDREINICIENGELKKADSLIHTVFDPTTAVERNRAAKAEVEKNMKLAQELIDKANARIDEIRQDSDYAKSIMNICENLAQEHLSQGNKLEAKKYLEQSLSIRRVLYGEDSKQVSIMKEKIERIK